MLCRDHRAHPSCARALRRYPLLNPTAQYQLRRRAVDYGWPEARVLVIDDDQGISGQSIEGRLGFQRLLAEISPKGPDFVSRLSGHIDIIGPNPTDEYDQAYVIRRALILRQILREKLGQETCDYSTLFQGMPSVGSRSVFGFS